MLAQFFIWRRKNSEKLCFELLAWEIGHESACAIIYAGEDICYDRTGKIQCLNVVKKTDFGVYLGKEDEKVLLPGKMVPEDIEIGDALTVFVYRDSDDRLIATTKKPFITLGQLAKLKVSQISKIGAFLDWGLEKDLFLPYKEQTTHVAEGDECLVALYVDKSNRLAATMRVYHYLVNGSDYVKDSAVSGTVIEINPDRGVYVAVDDKYYGMIPKNGSWRSQGWRYISRKSIQSERRWKADNQH